MEIKDISKLQIYTAIGRAVLKRTDGTHFIHVVQGVDFSSLRECVSVAALFRAAPMMLEALNAVVVGERDWQEKVLCAIEAAQNTNETL